MLRRRAARAHRDGHHGPRRRRAVADHRRPVRGHEGGIRRLLPVRARQPRRGARGRGQGSRGTAGRVGRGPRARSLVDLEQVFREHWARVLAYLVGYFRDFDLAEEAAQEAFATAAARWERDGPPDNAGAWLMTTARNRAIDRLRRENVLAEKTKQLEVKEAVEDEMDDIDATAIPDERLELLFTCCHPALSTEAQVALTLYAV